MYLKYQATRGMTSFNPHLTRLPGLTSPPGAVCPDNLALPYRQRRRQQVVAEDERQSRGRNRVQLPSSQTRPLAETVAVCQDMAEMGEIIERHHNSHHSPCNVLIFSIEIYYFNR